MTKYGVTIVQCLAVCSDCVNVPKGRSCKKVRIKNKDNLKKTMLNDIQKMWQIIMQNQWNANDTKRYRLKYIYLKLIKDNPKGTDIIMIAWTGYFGLRWLKGLNTALNVWVISDKSNARGGGIIKKLWTRKQV